MATVPPTSSTSVLDRFAGFVKSINPFTSTTPVNTPAAPAAAPTAPVAPVIAPIQQPAPAAVQKPVDVALKTLTTSDLQKDLDQLWNDKVTKASTLGKIFGVISYVFNLPSVYANSLAARATINELNTSTEALVKAVCQRSLTDAEKLEANAPKLSVITNSAQLFQAGLNLEAKAALENFYSVFAKRVDQLGVSKDSEEFGNLTKAAEQMIRNAGEVGRKALAESSKSLNKRQSFVVPMQVETTVAEFKKVAVLAMINEIAGKATLEQITPDNFKSTVEAIAIVAPNQRPANVHAEIRRAIQEKHNVNFPALIQEFSDVNADSRVNVAIRNGIKGALETDKRTQETSLAAINAELAPLTGDNGFNGSVDAAFRAKEVALGEYNVAEAAYKTLRFPGAPANVTRRDLIGLPLNPSAELSAAHANAVTKLQALEAAEAAYDALDERCQTLLTEKRTVEGKLGQIALDLNDGQLAFAVRTTREKSLHFYQELQVEATPINMVTRFNSMNAIIGN